MTTLVIFILCLYRLQREANLLHDRKRDYVTHKINKAFPIIAILISIIICLSSILSFILVIKDARTEILIISSVSDLILGMGLIILSVIMLGFVHNIAQNFSVDLERLLVDFIQNNSQFYFHENRRIPSSFILIQETSARDELLKIENSNDCCSTQNPIWVRSYTKAAECDRNPKMRLIYADQDEVRGCVKVVTETAISLMPILISEMTCGTLSLLLGLWTIYLIYRRYQSNDDQSTVNEVSITNASENNILREPIKNATNELSQTRADSLKKTELRGSTRQSFLPRLTRRTDSFSLTNPISD